MTMRNHINLVEQWFNTVDVYGTQVDIFKNPTRSEYAKLMAQIAKTTGGTQSGSTGGPKLFVRANVSPDGSLYIWDAYHATHGDIIDDGHVGETVGGYIYLGADFVYFNDLHYETREARTGPVYGAWVRRYYEACRSNASLKSLFGPNFRIVGVDYEDVRGLGIKDKLIEIDDDFIEKYVART